MNKLIRIIRFIMGKNANTSLLKSYSSKDYLKAYSRHTDIRVKKDPQSAIGGQWEEVGMLQFQFLKEQGLKSTNTLLDIGCGTLRGGQHFIKYLNTDKYAGIDISPKVISHAREFVENIELTLKNPRLILNLKMNLDFSQFNERFDFLLAQSVFTHLMPEHIEECFENIGGIMDTSSLFYFTYFEGSNNVRRNLKDFEYPFSFFSNLAGQNNFLIEDVSREYPHPRGQKMLVIRKRTDR